MHSDIDVARCWDENAAVWTRHVREGFDILRELCNNPAFLDFAGDLTGLRVLDAGCGEGYNTRLFAERGARMTGIDIAPAMIDFARAEEKNHPLGIRYEQQSMCDMPLFPDESFDAVVSTMALMDCADYPGAVREFRRVLRPGGLLAYSVLHPCFAHRNVRGWEYNENGEVTGVRLGDYFEGGSYEESWKFGAAPDAQSVEPFTVIYFDRMLADLLNPFCDGFRLTGILEPRPSDEACRREPRLWKHRLVPQALFIKARKCA
ncbi:MAG: class I SAM-dependent methyltransferase [Armatimonadota bacterium]